MKIQREIPGLVVVALASLLSVASSTSSRSVVLSSNGSSASVEGSAGRFDDRAAPVAPRGRSTGPGVYEDGLPYCQSNLDCDGVGNWCKDRGDGIQLCMSSDGHPGDYCTSGLDCGRGLFCKDRGDGLKMCMGGKRGRRGAFCNSSLDCGRGLWCKDRGDGLNVCM